MISQNIFFDTYGCTANMNNTEIMMGLLEEEGHRIVDTEEVADIVVINTCIVKGKTESKILKRLKELIGDFPAEKVIVTGCMPDAESEVLDNVSEKISLLSSQRIKEISRVVSAITKSEQINILGRNKEVKLKMPRKRKNEHVHIVQVSEGCTGACSFCITKFAKGHVFSYPEKDILDEIDSSGCKEIWLTSQDTGAYGYDRSRKSELPQLMRRIGNLEGDFMVRVGMMNPDHVLPDLDEFVDAFKNPRFYRFVHIPVQAGDDQVLKDMRRKYTVGEFRKVVQRFRREIPDISIATDIICGFPTESDEQFERTVELVKEIGFDVINISRYTPRPKTASSQMKMQPSLVMKQRSARLTDVFHETARNKNREWLGWKGKVLVTEKGKDSTWIGRNPSYKQVIITGDALMGRCVSTEVTGATSFDLRAKLIDERPYIKL